VAILPQNQSNQRVYGLCALVKWTGEALGGRRLSELVGFSPLPGLAVDFRDFAVAKEFVNSMKSKESREYFPGGGTMGVDLRSRAVFPGLANSLGDRPGRSTETEQ
jgi:hypothetical protein